MEGKIETAKKFYQMGFPLEQISKGTGLSIAKLKEILEKS